MKDLIQSKVLAKKLQEILKQNSNKHKDLLALKARIYNFPYSMSYEFVFIKFPRWQHHISQHIFKTPAPGFTAGWTNESSVTGYGWISLVEQHYHVAFSLKQTPVKYNCLFCLWIQDDSRIHPQSLIVVSKVCDFSIFREYFSRFMEFGEFLVNSLSFPPVSL